MTFIGRCPKCGAEHEVEQFEGEVDCSCGVKLVATHDCEYSEEFGSDCYDDLEVDA